MKRTATYIAAIAAAAGILFSCGTKKDAEAEKRYEVVGYVWEKEGLLPPADAVTVINYCFFSPDSTGKGIVVPNESRLLQVMDLKKENPELKVLFSFGGANAKVGYADICADEQLRREFADSCRALVDKYGADGIDFDWEFPHGDEQLNNYVLLLRDLRQALGKDKMLTIAAGFRSDGLKMPEMLEYLDFVNIMSYDMGWEAPYHHTAMRRSPLCNICTIEESVDFFLKKGVPYDKLVLGLGFYGRGNGKEFKHWTDYRDITPGPGMEERWDSIACVPYIVDSLGTLVVGYDNPRSLEIKCDYIKEKGFRGAMTWRSELDKDNYELTRTVQRCLLDNR